MNETKFFQETYEAFKEVISRPGLNQSTINRIIKHASKRFGLTEEVAKQLQNQYRNLGNLDDFLRVFIQNVQEEGIFLADKKLNINPSEIVYEIPNTGVMPTRRIKKQRTEQNVGKKSKSESLKSDLNQEAEVQKPHKQKEVKNVTPVVLKTLKRVDISELSSENGEISKDKMDKFIKQLLMEGVTLNEVEFTNNGKHITDLKYFEIYKNVENRLKEVTSKLRERNTFNFQTIYGEDIIRVFRWILCKGKEPKRIYEDMQGLQNQVKTAYEHGPERLIRIMDSFTNSNDGLDLCTAIFIIERLVKSEKFHAIIHSNLDIYNNRYKSKVDGFFNELFGLENEKKSEQIER